MGSERSRSDQTFRRVYVTHMGKFEANSNNKICNADPFLLKPGKKCAIRILFSLKLEKHAISS